MRILFVTSYYKPAFVYGGPVRSIAALCEGLVKTGSTVTVFTTNANGKGQSLDVPTDRPVQVEGVDVCYFPLAQSAPWIPFYSPNLGQACQAEIKRFDIVYFYATWTYPMLAGAKAAYSCGIPYVVSPRGAFMTQSLQEKWLKKRLYYWLIERNLIKQSKAIHCTSELEQQQLAQFIAHPKSVLIPNGLDLKPFISLPMPGAFRARLGLPANALLSIFVGRIAPEKRLELTVNAFAKVAAQVPEAHLAFVGHDAGSGRTVFELIKSLDLQDRIHMVGGLLESELPIVYRDADLLVLLSRRENFGMAAVEAMAAAVPVLLTEEVGLADQVARADAGCKVSASVDEIAHTWHQLLTAPQQERKSMGLRGRALVQQCFSQEVTVSRMYKLFEEIALQSKGISKAATNFAAQNV